MFEMTARIMTGALPVIVFLVTLVLLDTFKLTGAKSVLLALAVGVVAAMIGYFINNLLLARTGCSYSSYCRYIAPFIEEFLKSAYLVYLVSSKRIGFMIDAAVYGFAVGAGFAIVENVQYLATLGDATVLVWIVRGFGTAVMHGGATALFAILAKNLSNLYRGAWIYLPGFAVAVFIHSIYNHFFLSAELSAAGMVVIVPLLMVLVFRQSERSLRDWLGIGFDTDQELYEMIKTGNISESRIGRYLLSLKEHFPGELIADMLCLLRLHLELSIRAKGMLLMRDAGFDVPVDPSVRETFEELRYLERSIGRTGKLAIMPVLKWSSRDLWQLYMLGKR